MPEEVKSYQQKKLSGPDPLVVVEIPSTSDTFDGLLDKLSRYSDLGVVAYVVRSRAASMSILKHGLDGQLMLWGNTPIPELGGLVLDTIGSDVVALGPDGHAYRSDHEFLARLRGLAQTEAARADTEAARAAALVEQLRALGVEPAV